jgi:hypothetical protein
MSRRAAIARTSLVIALSALPGLAQATPPAASSAASSKKPPASDAAQDRAQDRQARRAEAKARLKQFLANPPDTAPAWMKRAAAERRTP